MKYQLLEKPIYSEADLLHFGETVIFGDIINSQLPDYSGVPFEEPIFETEDKEEANTKKQALEIKRLRTLNGMVNGFFDDDALAEKFYASANFTALVKLYDEEFFLELIRKNHNQMDIKYNEFHIPPEASDEIFLNIWNLLDLEFYNLREVK
jgi:hypothetical protein